jgi:uracil-DNA glycosylase family 4
MASRDAGWVMGGAEPEGGGQAPGELAALAHACRQCERCSLAAGRHQVVVARGNPRARLLLIGEAPGAEEDRQGLPFVGRSGQLLDRLLAEAGIDSQREAYIVNGVKCRPPDNRRPRPAELAACRPWLERQIALVDPPLLLLVGATALEAVLGIKGGITRLRGTWIPGEGPLLQGRLLLPLLHPSYLLRNASEAPDSPRWHTRADLAAVRHRLDAAAAGQEGGGGGQGLARPRQAG